MTRCPTCKKNLQDLKTKAEAMFAEIAGCLDEDGEWTSPRGNGVNSAEAFETATAFMELIVKATEN